MAGGHYHMRNCIKESAALGRLRTTDTRPYKRNQGKFIQPMGVELQVILS